MKMELLTTDMTNEVIRTTLEFNIKLFSKILERALTAKTWDIKSSVVTTKEWIEAKQTEKTD